MSKFNCVDAVKMKVCPYYPKLHLNNFVVLNCVVQAAYTGRKFKSFVYDRRDAFKVHIVN